MKLSDYTTEALKRLTALTVEVLAPGEYVRGYDTTYLCTDGGHLVDRRGRERSKAWLPYEGALRRVASFTDPTDLDPPQAEMLAELKRRERPAVSNVTHAGRRVRSHANGSVGILLDEPSADRHQRGWEAEGYTGVYVWAMYANGRVVGNGAERWDLLD